MSLSIDMIQKIFVLYISHWSIGQQFLPANLREIEWAARNGFFCETLFLASLAIDNGIDLNYSRAIGVF